MEENNQIDAKSNRYLLFTAIFTILLVIAIVTNGFGLFSAGFAGQAIKTNIELSIDNSPVLGNPDAPITIYEFSDFSCPYCAASAGYNPQVISALKKSNPKWEAPIPNIIKDYVNGGKVKIVFKYAPGHGAGKPAHLIALGLKEQNPDLFWQFADLAFENMEKTGDLLEMKSLAKQIGADMDRLEKDLSSDILENQLNRDIEMGKSNNIKGTPAFIINGKLISGAQSYSEFKKIIDSELA